MLKDQHNRHINYLRISVTDKCNLRCQYCMPPEGVLLKTHEDILRLEEIIEIARYALSIGFTKLRLTGGEPLVRKNIIYLVEQIAKLPGLQDFGMTTNGQLLADHAKALKQAGLQRINISLDSLDPEKYQTITCGGDIAKVFQGIQAALKAELLPVKLNVVLIPGFNDNEREAFLDFGKAHNIEVRFIHKMDLHSGQRNGVEGATNVGQCEYCNRLRLTSDGGLKSCLFSEEKINIREIGIEQAFARALQTKPKYGIKNETELMYQIGG